jgi:hypothetical protein
MSGDRYNFAENILKLSQTKQVEYLPEEWAVLDHDTDLTEPVRCVCNAKVKKSVYILYNSTTRRFANAGDSCVKRFKPKSNKKPRQSGFFDYLSHHKVEYSAITNVFVYSDEIAVHYRKFLFEKLMSELIAKVRQIRREKEWEEERQVRKWRTEFRKVVKEIDDRRRMKEAERDQEIIAEVCRKEKERAERKQQEEDERKQRDAELSRQWHERYKRMQEERIARETAEQLAKQKVKQEEALKKQWKARFYKVVEQLKGRARQQRIQASPVVDAFGLLMSSRGDVKTKTGKTFKKLNNKKYYR